MNSKILILTCALAAAALLPACETVPIAPPAPVKAVSFADLRQRYNSRTGRIAKMWSRATVEIDWIDERGREQSERGDGPLIVRKPGELAMAVGKLGNTLLWLGGDPQRFWLFDMNPPKDSPTVAYVGLHADVGEPGMPELQVPIRPDQLVHLLGITDLPAGELSTSATTTAPSVWYRVPQARGGELRILVDTQTALPTTIQFVEASGAVVAESRLSEYKPMAIEGVTPGVQPAVATRVEITVPRRRAKVTLFLSRMTSSKTSDAQFDFDSLVKSLKPQEVRWMEPRE